MIPKYVASLAAAVLLVSAACTTLRFATRSQVLSGKAVEETWQLEFTLDADNKHTYKISPELQEALEQGIRFVGQGPVQVDSASVNITPKDVTWREDNEDITSTGASLVAHVKWETPAASANDAYGDIRLVFPATDAGEFDPHSGAYSKDDQGHWIMRDVATYRSAPSLFFARLGLAFALGFPLAILLHSLWWAFQLKKEKRSRIAAFPPQGDQLPRTFYPNPIREWTWWTILLAIFAFEGAFFAVFAAMDGLMDSQTYGLILFSIAAGAVAGLMVASITRMRVVTVRVDSGGISYARGRGNLQWVSKRWTDVLSVRAKAWWSLRGGRWAWLEVKFADAKKLRLPEDTVNYPALRDLIAYLFAHRNAPA